ncbi:hypothetical protein ATO10_15200 [Actibacterium atlanticum]|uniref:Uncharacterized protein n=2 Tax=Actibacterium atlanticum TaxID=1461693 RepID=A0A058ZH11_9RHOB|nr:hypothetical protein ATO10_15200 [Actibacterium atlanticum]
MVVPLLAGVLVATFTPWSDMVEIDAGLEMLDWLAVSVLMHALVTQTMATAAAERPVGTAFLPRREVRNTDILLVLLKSAFAALVAYSCHPVPAVGFIIIEVQW